MRPDGNQPADQLIHPVRPTGSDGVRPGPGGFSRWLLPGLLVLLASGCASLPEQTRHPQDPFERYNRAMFAFNDQVDRAVLKPVASAYAELPSPVRTGVGNFFGNLGDVPILLNNVLQGKWEAAASDTLRVMVNSTFGFFGLLDLASPMGLTKHDEDFGQTLGFWGVPAGPYLQLPFLGPSTLRDAPARWVDAQVDPLDATAQPSQDAQLAARVLEGVHRRATLLPFEAALPSLGEDRYVAVRTLWLQRREFQVRDGAAVTDDTWHTELDTLEALEALEAQEALEGQDGQDGLEERNGNRGTR